MSSHAQTQSATRYMTVNIILNHLFITTLRIQLEFVGQTRAERWLDSEMRTPWGTVSLTVINQTPISLELETFRGHLRRGKTGVLQEELFKQKVQM